MLGAGDDPITCVEIGKSPGVTEGHCSKCRHFGRIEAPVELAAAGEARAGGAGIPRQAATAAPTPADAPGARRPKNESRGQPQTLCAREIP